MTEQVGLGDEIARCVIFPRMFEGPAHVDELLFAFGAADADGACHESGVLCRLFDGPDGVQEAGCRIAASQNARLQADADSPKRRYYCGFRTASADRVAISGDGFKVILTLDGENGEPSHVDIALHVEATQKSERNMIKVEAGMTLAEAFGPVVPHICPVDADNPRHPLVVDPECLTRGIPRLASLFA